MLHEVMEHFRLAKEFRSAGYFETEASKEIFRELKTIIEAGHLVALAAIQGTGKTKTCRRLREELLKERKILVSTSLAVDKDRVKIGTLIDALFADLVTDKSFKIPAKTEIRERRLRDLIKKRGKPIVLFVDEAHDLHPKTLVGLKRLLEVVQDQGAAFSIVLIGLPKLVVTLKRPALEEIGTRTRTLTLDLIAGHEREFIEWLIGDCTKRGVKPTDVFTSESIDLMAETLRTPLQIIHYGWQALEMAYQIGLKVVETETVQAVLAPDLHGVEASLVRQGFTEKHLCDTFNMKPREVRAFFRGELTPSRTQELHYQLLQMGVLDTGTEA